MASVTHMLIYSLLLFVFIYLLINTKEYSIALEFALFSLWIILLKYGMALQMYSFILSICYVFCGVLQNYKGNA
jgi:hypothetical protein